MAYNADIPQASDDPSQSQGQILANFQALNTFLSVNHVDINDPTQGQHKFLQMPEQASAPSTAGNTGAVYTKEVSGATQLFFRNESNGSERQITGAFSTGVTDGMFTLPGGLSVKWGRRNNVNDNGTITFASPFASALYNVSLTLVRNDTNSRFMYYKDGSGTSASFEVRTNASNTSVFFIAIGM
jgi:hypothetical protein